MENKEFLDSEAKEELLALLESKAMKENTNYETFEEFMESQGVTDSDLPPKGMESVELMFLLGKEWAGKTWEDGDADGLGDGSEEKDWDIWDDWDESDYEWYEKHRNAESWDEDDWDDGWEESDVWNGFWGTESDDPEVIERRKRIDELWGSCMDRVLGRIVEERYEKRPQEVKRHRFSLRFKWKMAKAMRAFKSKEKEKEKKAGSHSLPVFLRPLSSARVAVAMAAVMVVLLGTTVRGTNPIIVWMYETWMVQHGDYVEIEGREDEVKVADNAGHSFKKYELAEVPEGYELQDEMYEEGIGVYHVYYTNEKQQTLVFKQGNKGNNNLGNVTANRKDMEKVTVGGFEGYFIHDTDMNNLILSDEDYTLLFTGDLSKEELLEIAGNLRKAE